DSDNRSLHWTTWKNHNCSPAYSYPRYPYRILPTPLRPLIELFEVLFSEVKDQIIIGQSKVGEEWGGFCMDTWDMNRQENNYDFSKLSSVTIDYLNLLLDSRIEFDYRGFCRCHDWEHFLRVILGAIISHKAPYSPIFYNISSDYIFYFHHTFSIGLFYRKQNDAVETILKQQKRNGYTLK
ncbi:MAG: hypothetical protein AAFY76_04290, partial [Cyanobacteria bacterium J06649_11]